VDSNVQDDVLHPNGYYKELYYPGDANRNAQNQHGPCDVGVESMDSDVGIVEEELGTLSSDNAGSNPTAGGSVLPSSSSMLSQPSAILGVGVKRKHQSSVFGTNESKIDVDDGSNRLTKLFKSDDNIDNNARIDSKESWVDSPKKFYICPEVQKTFGGRFLLDVDCNTMRRDINQFSSLMAETISSHQMAVVPWVPLARVTAPAHMEIQKEIGIAHQETQKLSATPIGSGLLTVPSSLPKDCESDDDDLDLL